MKEKTPEQLVRSQIREIRKEMKEKQIKRSSCFNGGHTPESYRLNAEMFRLETELSRIKGES